MWSLLSDLANSIAYSLIGFVLGWLVGYEARTLDYIRRSCKISGDMEGDPGEDESMTETRSSTLGRIGYAIILLSLLTILQSAYFSYTQRKTSECLSEYNKDFSEVYDLRSKFAEYDREAFTRFLDTYQQSPPPTEAERLSALLTLRADYARTEELRDQAPFPALEEC